MRFLIAVLLLTGAARAGERPRVTVTRGHSGGIDAVASSPDGTLVASRLAGPAELRVLP